MSTSYRGKFVQGSTPNLLLKITDFDGTPLAPSSITCTITQGSASNSTEIVSGTPFQGAIGFYVFEWELEADQEVGDYTVTWEYTTSELGTQTETQTVTVVESVTAPTFYTNRVIAFRDALEYHLSCAQSIPVYYEQAKPSRDRVKFEFSFNDWNQSPGVRIYRNGSIMNSGFDVDYFTGSVDFEDNLVDQDVVNADYNFRWFSDDDLNRFLGNAVQTVNAYPPNSGYYMENIPDRFIPVVLYGAAKDALRQLMMCLQFQQPAQIFGGMEEASRAFGNMETLKKNYEGDWEKLLEQKKYGPYPTSRAIVTPEYTLPGGRSRWFRYLFKG
jgi:hypothetical protein